MKMDVLILISGILFFAADVFAVASLANPEWVVSDDSSKLDKNSKFNK